MELSKQIYLFMWKNWLLQKKKICVSIFEIIIPVLFGLLFVFLRNFVKVNKMNTTYFTESIIAPTSDMFSKNAIIGYTPKTGTTDNIMSNILTILKKKSIGENFSIHGFISEEEAVYFYQTNPHQMQQIFVFDILSQEALFPRNLKITIRSRANENDWNTKHTYPDVLPDSESSQLYITNGFLFLQTLICQALLQYWSHHKGSSSVVFVIGVKRMADPVHYFDPLAASMQGLGFQLYMVLSFVLSVIVNTKMLVYEKERKIKESLSVMGFSPLAQRIAWFLTFCCYLIPTMAMFTVAFCFKIVENGPVLQHSDGILFFIFLLCYALAIITLCFMISTLVKKAITGAVLSGVLFIAFFIPYINIKSTTSRMMKFICSLSFNCAVSLGIKTIGISEAQGVGTKWNNFHKPPTVNGSYSLLASMLMLLLDSGIHILIAWYMENVTPGEFGIPRPYYFCFTRSFWIPESTTEGIGSENKKSESKYFEKEPTDKIAGIRISNLYKKFGPNIAVNGITLNMYEGQITALLGHNGAGKTTTMSLLTGFLPPTSGTAIISNYNIKTNLESARKNLGLCPQHDILFDTLTVYEHLMFFAKVKDIKTSDLKSEVEQIAKNVELENKLNTRSKNLSGGQKRKLSVAIALIGGSKVVILDEPTSGMDPAARRHMWNVLQEARKNRTLLLSTQYMDEADVLGDRIAIMMDGVVKCCGSSLFLKKLYGTGYHLVIVRKKDCDVSNLTNFIKSFIPNAELETVRNTEVTYLLPDSESRKFSNLLRKLENEKVKLKIDSFGTSATTMEEVFLKVGETITDPVNKDDDFKASENKSINIPEHSFISTIFTLVVVKRSDCDVNNLTKTITNFIPNAEIANMTATEVTYSFPDSGRDIVQDILHYLETHKNDLGIESFELQSPEAIETDLDHGCNKVSVTLLNQPKQATVVIVDTQPLSFNTGFIKKSGVLLEWSRIYGIFVKKLICSGRKWSLIVPQMLIPVLVASFIVLFVIEEKSNEPPLNFDLSPFEETYIPYTDGINPTTIHSDFANLYAKQFGSSHKTEFFKIAGKSTFNNYTVQRATELGLDTFNRKMIIGMQVIHVEPSKNITCIAYYNGFPLHAVAISVNYVLNTVYQFILNDTFSIQTSINPLPKFDVRIGNQQESTNGTLIGTLIYMSLCVTVSLFIMFLIQEREVGAKHIQTICGVGPVTYWLPTFLLDFTIYILISMPVVIVFGIYKLPPLIDDGRWKLLILVLVLYGWAMLAHLYVFQFLFKSSASGVSFGIIYNFFSGIVSDTVVEILKIAYNKEKDRVDFISLILLCLFPTYNLLACFINIHTNYDHLKVCIPLQPQCLKGVYHFCCKDTCGDDCLSFHSDYTNWNRPGIGALLFIMLLQGFFCIVILLVIEYRIILRIWYYIFRGSRNYKGVTNKEDEDVACERQRINSTKHSILISSDSLVFVNLYKRYRDFVAVDHICLGVPEQECFGLLGQNGAGKTTIFKMLTGDVIVTGGNAYLKGFDVKNNIHKVQTQMGYCPQFDALIDLMTGRETLTLYARLRGIPEDKIKMVVERLSDSLMITPHIDKYVSQYSGGNKRKLSTAVALIGSPTFVILDEPSAGMDPEVKRHLWSLLSQVRTSGCTLVLTSHSMEECDALCTRLAIMVNGRFMCLGSPQHLKNKFGQGYTLITQLKTLEDGTYASNQPVIGFLTSHFPDAKVFDNHQGYIHFQVPDTCVKLADVFDIMETAKTEVNVKDYSVHQTTLEEVFLSFTMTQIPPTLVQNPWNPFKLLPCWRKD